MTLRENAKSMLYFQSFNRLYKPIFSDVPRYLQLVVSSFNKMFFSHKQSFTLKVVSHKNVKIQLQLKKRAPFDLT